MNEEDITSRLSALNSSYNRLQNEVISVFKLLNEEYLKQIKINDKIENIITYTTNWFISYLAFKDEVMVLIQGAVHRRYHVKLHEKYKHERSENSQTGHEARFYSGSLNIYFILTIDN